MKIITLDELKSYRMPQPGETPVQLSAWGKVRAVIIPVEDAQEALEIGELVESYFAQKQRDEMEL